VIDARNDPSVPPRTVFVARLAAFIATPFSGGDLVEAAGVLRF